jgi:hypothetical protein
MPSSARRESGLASMDSVRVSHGVCQLQLLKRVSGPWEPYFAMSWKVMRMDRYQLGFQFGPNDFGSASEINTKNSVCVTQTQSVTDCVCVAATGCV